MNPFSLPCLLEHTQITFCFATKFRLTTRMEHRGASGADNATGDGAGAMVTIAHELFQEELRSVKILFGI
jgi:glutamate synthase domain-containing protein 1